MKTIARLRATLLLLYLCRCGSASDCQLGKASGNLNTYIAHLRKYDILRWTCVWLQLGVPKWFIAKIAGVIVQPLRRVSELHHILIVVVCCLTGSFHIQICNTRSLKSSSHVQKYYCHWKIGVFHYMIKSTPSLRTRPIGLGGGRIWARAYIGVVSGWNADQTNWIWLQMT